MTTNLNFPTILSTHFDTPLPQLDLTILRDLKSLHPDSQHIPVSDTAFPLASYLASINVAVDMVAEREVDPASPSRALAFGLGGGSGTQYLPNVQHQLFGWNPTESKVQSRLVTGRFRFTYEGTEFLVYKITWQHDRQFNCIYDLVFSGPTNDPGTKLLGAVYTWFNALKEEIWVFQQGHWMKDHALWTSIQAASSDDLVLTEDFLDGLRRDTRTFFENKEIYGELGITWKRGILLLGPPGNGKTESIKVLLKESGQAALYVKSFSAHGGPEFGVKNIFDHARMHAPCILVIEDLDSLVTDNVRSFFLNELDGIGQNEGILTIATTNHPEKIDDAILNRPSRFDVKYNFDLPDAELRQRYVVKWLRKIKASMAKAQAKAAEGRSGADERAWVKSEEELAKDVAEKTDGWSFAFLKELFVSFLLRVAHDKAAVKARASASTTSTSSTASTAEPSSPSSLDDTLLIQVDQLSAQIITVEKLENGENPSTAGGSGMDMGMMFQRGGPLRRTQIATRHAVAANNVMIPSMMIGGMGPGGAAGAF